MRKIPIRFASTNAPESAKRGLLQNRFLRARRLAKFYLNKGIDIAAVQEAGTYLPDAAKKTGKLKTLWAKANSIVKGRLVGNGVVINKIRFKAKRMPDIQVGDLYLAVVKVTHRRTGFTFTVYAIHRRTRRDDPTGEDRRAMNEVLRAEIKSLERIGAAWVILGDANEGEQWAIADLGVRLGNHGVDHGIGSKHFVKVAEHVFDRDDLSDHDFLVMDTLASAA